MVKLSFLESKIQHKASTILSTFMKITRVNKLKNKIMPSFQVSPTLNKLLYELKCPAISFVFVEMTPFSAVKP